MKKYKEEVKGEELQEYPIKGFEGEIIIVNNPEEVNFAVRELKKSKLVGFDTETRPSFKKGQRNKVALLQLASEEKAFLFRINRIGVPDVLKEFLADPSIIKTGVAISDDIKGLNEWSVFEPGGFIELQHLVKDYGIVSMGLKKLTAIVLGFTISKRQQVTNWENESLTRAQIIYAATDAWVCNLIYKQLLNGES